MKTSPCITLSQLRAILHSWFHFGRNTRFFQSRGRIDKGSVGQKYPVFLPKRNQECKIALSCDKVIPGEGFIDSGSSYLTFPKITNFMHAATTGFKFYVIMKWAIVRQKFDNFYYSKFTGNTVWKIHWKSCLERKYKVTFDKVADSSSTPRGMSCSIPVKFCKYRFCGRIGKFPNSTKIEQGQGRVCG